jgi:WhiB family redox-sensing transcriptional regulator
MEWIRDAACRGEPPETFFPKGAESTARAMWFCARCSVQAECLAYAMADPSLSGIWGGNTSRSRLRLLLAQEYGAPPRARPAAGL